MSVDTNANNLPNSFNTEKGREKKKLVILRS